MAGGYKHSEAQSIVDDYQNDIKHRGLKTEVGYRGRIKANHNDNGSSKLDVRDSAISDAYDYKFVLKPGKGV